MTTQKAESAPSRRPIVLASQSPRRRALLEAAGMEVIVRPSGCDELWSEGDATNAVVAIARDKLRHARRPLDKTKDRALIELPWLAADTAVLCKGDVLGKPESKEHARHMLGQLASAAHEVVTGVVVRFGDIEQAQAVVTRVTFRALDDDDIERYLTTEEWRDKAGGYAIQGEGASLVEKVEGSLTNVIGLPVSEALASVAALCEEILSRP